MKRHLLCGAVLTLAIVVLFALPDRTSAGSMHSGGSQWGRPSAPAYVLSYVPSSYAIPTVSAMAPPAENDYAYGSTEELVYYAAPINVRVPANAEVWFDGTRTSQTGSQRSFVSPPIQPGRDYVYEIRARWVQAGRPVEETRRIIVRAGDRDNLNFLTP